MKIPDALTQIAADITAGRTRRAKVRTLMGWYGLKKRRDAGISVIRDHLRQLGIETVPPFDTPDFDGQVRFVPMGSAGEEDAAAQADNFADGAASNAQASVTHPSRASAVCVSGSSTTMQNGKQSLSSRLAFWPLK